MIANSKDATIARAILLCLLTGISSAHCEDAAKTAAQQPAKTSDKPTDYPLAKIGPKPKPVPTPAASEIEASIARGVAFLVKRQNANGSWGSERSSRPEEIYAPIPGAHQSFRAATTALCISALIEIGDDRPGVHAALDRGEKWLEENIKSIRRNSADALYNNWAHIYAIDCLVHMLHRHAGDKAHCDLIRGLIEHQIGMLVRFECTDGGWCYYDMEAHTQHTTGSTISFVTGAALVSLADAKEAGITAPDRIVKRAIASIDRQRKPDFSYEYGEYLKSRPMLGVNRPGGSLGRTQCCDLALRMWGDKAVSDEIVRAWLDRLFARELWLDMGRKRPVPHESWFQVAGYFFYFGHYYAGRSIEELPEAERGPYRDQMAHVMLPLQQPDGSWWDFPMYDYHQQYGTAFALMTLGHSRR